MTIRRFRELLPMKPIFEMTLCDIYISKVCRDSGVIEDQIRSKCSIREVSDARKKVQYWQYHNLKWSYPQIARYWGYRDHTTPRYNVMRAEQLNLVDNAV